MSCLIVVIETVTTSSVARHVTVEDGREGLDERASPTLLVLQFDTVHGQDEEVHGRAAVLAGVDAVEEPREVVQHAAEWGKRLSARARTGERVSRRLGRERGRRHWCRRRGQP